MSQLLSQCQVFKSNLRLLSDTVRSWLHGEPAAQAGSGFLNLILLSSFGYCKAMRQHMLDFQLNAGRFFLSATAHLGLALGFGGLFVMTSFLCSGCASGFAAL